MEVLEKTILYGENCPDDFVELTGLDILTGHLSVHGLYYFTVTPDLGRLKRSLAAALSRYPAFAGGLLQQGTRLFVSRNNIGVRFSVFHCTDPLTEHSTARLSLADCPWADTDYHGSLLTGTVPLTSFRITLFPDSHWALVIRNVHSVGDGAALAHLLRCWANLYRTGLPIPGGTHTRRNVAALGIRGGHKPSDQFAVMPSANFNLGRRLQRNRKVYQSTLVHLPPVELEALIQFCKRQTAGLLTSSDVLHALLWKTFALACEFPGGESSQLYSAFDLRRVRGLSIPASYIGNAVLERRARLAFTQLRAGSITDIARHFHRSTKPVDEQDIRRDIAFLQREYEAGHINSEGCFAHFIRSSMVDCLLGTGLFINDLRFIPSSALTFEDRTCWFEAIPALGFNAAFIYLRGDQRISIRIIGHRDWLQPFIELLGQSVRYVI